VSDYPNTSDLLHAIADLPQEIRDGAARLVGEFSSLGEDGSAVLAQRTSSLVRLVWTKAYRAGWEDRAEGLNP